MSQKTLFICDRDFMRRRRLMGLLFQVLPTRGINLARIFSLITDMRKIKINEANLLAAAQDSHFAFIPSQLPLGAWKIHWKIAKTET